jgi:hypothetical protein
MIGRSIYEPVEWLVCFPTGPRLFWFDWLARRRMKHVVIFGYVAETNVWIHYNVNYFRTIVEMMPPCVEVDTLLRAYQRMGPMLRVRPGTHHRFASHFFFYCVTAAKHLLAVKSGALTPYGLYRDLVALGATEIGDDDGLWKRT